MRLTKNFISIVLITTLLFLVCDFILSHLGFSLNRKNNSTTAACAAHPVYRHDLKQNLDIISPWGPITSRLCTNQFGFKVACNRAGEMRKDFDIAFIGDSFTESIGTTYESSFVGLYAQKHPDIAVANFGVRGYSASNYWKKIEFLLNNGFTFKHLVVLPDISDIADESSYIDENNDAIAENIKHNGNGEEETNENKANLLHRVLMRHFKFSWYINCLIYDYFHFDDEAVFKKLIEYQPAEWTRNIDSPHFGKAGVLGAIQKNLEYMRNMKKMLDERNIKMTIAVYPWPTQLFLENRSHLGVKIWKDFCIKEDCYNFIDANPCFFDEIQKSSKREVIKKYYIHGDIHFNEEGNKIMFEIINTHFKM